MLKHKIIIVPSFFHNLPKEIQDLVYEFNWEHRKLFKKVLSHLIEFTHCTYCNNVIGLDIVHKINYCSNDCLHYSWDNWSSYDDDF
jgi:hypothetical protein